MSQPAVDPGMERRSIVVWDPFVRVLHWLVAFGCLANLSILSDADEIHEWLGYAVLAAVFVRLVLGFVGSTHARFRDFVPGPAGLLGYLRLLVRGREPRYVGHNPAGAAMMVCLIVLILVCGISGWMMGLDRFWGESWLEDIHEGSANLILFAAILHVVGALVESVRHRENLILSMLTGRKRPPAGADVYHAVDERRSRSQDRD